MARSQLTEPSRDLKPALTHSLLCRKLPMEQSRRLVLLSKLTALSSAMINQPLLSRSESTLNTRALDLSKKFLSLLMLFQKDVETTKNTLSLLMEKSNLGSSRLTDLPFKSLPRTNRLLDLTPLRLPLLSVESELLEISISTLTPTLINVSTVVFHPLTVLRTSPSSLSRNRPATHPSTLELKSST